MQERLMVLFLANRNFAFCGLELLARLAGPFIPKWIKMPYSLARLEKRGLIESKKIGFKRYYALTDAGRAYNAKQREIEK